MSAKPLRENIFGVLAEFETPGQLVLACERVRDKGFSCWDAHTPFQVHGLESAMGLKGSNVPWFVLILGLLGATGGMLLQWWVSVKASPLVISGKPLFSWPAFVPIMFEVAVLGGALGALIGFLLLSGLPKPYHALFHSKRFERMSDDRFYISIEARDVRFHMEKTEQLLWDAGAVYVEWIFP